MKRRYFISASLPVVVADDGVFTRRLHVLLDLSLSFAHVTYPLVWV
jgi:hypothetical protein